MSNIKFGGEGGSFLEKQIGVNPRMRVLHETENRALRWSVHIECLEVGKVCSDHRQEYEDEGNKL
jgi:hypothetical protein